MHYYVFSFVIDRKDKNPENGNCVMRLANQATVNDFVLPAKSYYAGPEPYERISIPKWEEISVKEYDKLRENK